MGDLVGIIRRAGELADALKRLQELKLRVANVGATGGRRYNPGWHLALDLRNMLVVSECTAKAALEREESRGGHTREDFPAMDPKWRKVNLVCSLEESGDVHLEHKPLPKMRDGADHAVRPHRAVEVHHRGRTGRVRRGRGSKQDGGEVMGTKRHFRVWRGDSSGGDIQDFDVEVNDGEVVLDIIHRLQATQTPDLACRWNCKAGKCGSCSMEINGMPRLGCMTRMSTFEEDETITITPLRTFPVIRDLVTDVSFNYQKARETPAFAPPQGVAPGQYRMQQVDVERSQEFRKCIECFLCQNTCHVVRDHEENKPAFSGPRYFIRAAELDMHPLDARTDRKKYAQEHQGLGYVQHHQVLHRGLPRAHQDHGQRDHPDEGARGRPPLRPAGLARPQDLPPGRARAGAAAGLRGCPLLRHQLGRRGWRHDADDLEVHTSGTPFTSARRGEAPPVGPDGKLDVSELAAPHQAAPSPFGDEQEFPLPTGEFTYVQPAKPEEEPDNDKAH